MSAALAAAMKITAITCGVCAVFIGCAGEDDPALDETVDEVLVRDSRNPSTGGSQHRLDAAPIFELTFDLTAGRRVTFETRNRSAGSDPVLHLLAPVGANGPVTEVARDDDSAGDYNARLSYVPPTSGQYTLVMRAAWKNKSGTAELLQDSRPVWSALPFGGGFQRLEGLRVNEELVTVPLPHAPSSHTLYLLDDNGKLLERHVSGGTQSVTKRITVAQNLAIAMVGPGWLAYAGPYRLVRNDVRLSGHDPDGDGLGTELETHLGTCSRTTDIVGNFECSRAMDMRDTDGDGLDDKIELLGKLTSSPYQFLPRWGADPRHKDLFLEVDFLAKETSEADVKMTETVARGIAETYADPETSAYFRLANAQTLRNPDLEPGIRLHFDIGVNPPSTAPEADFALYGNWGGHNWVPPVCGNDGCKRAGAGDVWRQQMHANRHGVFHYLGGYPSGGGQAPPHSVANGIPLDSMGVAAHELGHTLGLGHNGPFDGEALDVNCKPTYPSLMSYAYLDRGYRRFSDGYGRAAINNTNLQEQYAISSPTGTPGSRYLQHLRDYFNYTVDMTNGHVDWNRDGTFQSTPVRAYANNNGGGCEFTKYNRVDLEAVSQRAPALARLGDMTVMLSIAADRTIVFEYTTDSLACPDPTVDGCGAAPQRASMGQSWNQRIDAIDAHRVVENGVAKLLIVYRTLDDELFEVTFTPWTFGTPRRIATATTPEAELSLAGNSAVTYLAYRGSDGRPMLKVRSSVTKEWADDEPVGDGNGALQPMGAGTSPALLEVVAGGQRTLYGVFATSSNDLRLYTFDTSTRVWTRSTWVMSAEATGKPAMAWVGLPADSVLPGRLHLFYLRNSASGKTVVQDLMLRARYYDANVLELGMYGGEHQNAWLYGYGLDLLYEPGVDSNLRMLLARKRLDDNDVPYASAVELRPKADGIVDFDQRNWNDWDVLRVDLCRTLVGSVSGSIRCPSWAW